LLSPKKEECRRFYDEISQRLDASIFGQFSWFLNFGYVAVDNLSSSVVELSDQRLNRNSARLVLEVIGDTPLTGRRVLDVGCGRGGTIAVIIEYFDPAAVCGVDLSPAAIAFCSSTHRHPAVTFEVGDAERLTFRDGAFDVVINVESSSTYPDISAFYREVDRVLAPRGTFLYTDAMPATRFEECSAYLRRLGWSLEVDRDIGANVLASCDDAAANRSRAYGNGGDGTMDDFLGRPGSRFYNEIRQGTWTYRIQRWRKPAVFAG
jgi:SAM-dependent methyltransferase